MFVLSAPKPKLLCCPDCSARPGEEHRGLCDVARCSVTGWQEVLCALPAGAHPPTTWTGLWPGVLECREYGWFTEGAHGMTEDLNRLAKAAANGELVWSVRLQRWFRA